MAESFKDRAAVVFAALLAAVRVVGGSLEQDNTLDHIAGSAAEAWGSVALAAAVFVCAALACHALFRLIPATEERLAAVPQTPFLPALFSERRTALLLLWAILFLCWLPCWLAYWPGIYNYDMPTVRAPSVYEGPYWNTQPLLHSFVINTLYDAVMTEAATADAAGSAEGSALVSACQLVLMSFVFAFIVHRLGRLRVPTALRLVCLLWFALNPVNALFAISETKDVPFAGVFALVTLLLVEFAQNAEAFLASRKKMIALGALALLLCLLRNNAAFALIALLALAAVFLRGLYCGPMRRLTAAFAGVAAAWFVLTGVVYPAAEIHASPSKEMLSVPAQQLAYTYNLYAKEMTDDERNMTTNNILIGLTEAYNPRLADPVKNYIRDWPSDEYSTGLMRHWFSLGLKYPKEYATAFLALNLASWYTGLDVPDPFSGVVYIETWNQPGAGFERVSKLPALLPYYESVATGAAWQSVPVLSLFFDTGAPLWLVFFGLLFCLSRRRTAAAVAFLLPIALWVTMMFGPVTNGRYVYPMLL
ncbi:MAG: DUF6020 family protein [Clostridiales Family XIII bacterium]|nr:DUF6020 family protein [Clostridiales Family XIII bacterium]